jgi:diadenosine tetraphosphatase ApaH/serine/threonine PP2A family protein phosphatase
VPHSGTLYEVSIAIVSDIHGNRQAFETVLEAIDAAGVEEVWCLGDLVGYGGDPDACVELAMRHVSLCLAGNHDLGVLGAVDLAEFSDMARQAAEWTRDTIEPRTAQFLGTLSPKDEDHEVGLYHASPLDPVWDYVLSPLQAALCVEVQARRVGLIGHSHIALAFWLEEGEMTGAKQPDGAELDIREGPWLINPGSVGQPRDGDPRAAWLELDLAAERVHFHRVDYDVEGAVVAIRRARLPDSLGERLRYGH